MTQLKGHSIGLVWECANSSLNGLMFYQHLDLRGGIRFFDCFILKSKIVYCKIHLGCGGRHFYRGMVFLEMFIWIRLINPVMVECISGTVILWDMRCLWRSQSKGIFTWMADSTEQLWCLLYHQISGINFKRCELILNLTNSRQKQFWIIWDLSYPLQCQSLAKHYVLKRSGLQIYTSQILYILRTKSQLMPCYEFFGIWWLWHS